VRVRVRAPRAAAGLAAARRGGKSGRGGQRSWGLLVGRDSQTWSRRVKLCSVRGSCGASVADSAAGARWEGTSDRLEGRPSRHQWCAGSRCGRAAAPAGARGPRGRGPPCWGKGGRHDMHGGGGRAAVNECRLHSCADAGPRAHEGAAKAEEYVFRGRPASRPRCGPALAGRGAPMAGERWAAPPARQKECFGFVDTGACQGAPKNKGGRRVLLRGDGGRPRSRLARRRRRRRRAAAACEPL
jgi:hypothetical protein